MIILGLTFSSVLGIVLGAYWLLIRRPESEARTRLRQRLATGSGATEATSSRVTRADWVGTPPAAGALWIRTLVIDALGRALARAGVKATAARTLKTGAFGIAAVVLVLLALGARTDVVLIVAALLAVAPFVVLRRRAAKRLQALETQLPRAIDLMSRALRAGHALTTVIAIVAEELPDPLRSEFQLTYEQHNYGMPLAQALRAFATRVPLLDARFLVTAVLTQRETGGNLAGVLDNLATVMRDRMRARRQMQVLTAQGRLTGWILALFPAGLAAVLWMWNPAQMSSMLRDPLGIQLLMTALVLQISGALVIQRILAVKY
jgi:tight adherence protein B